MELLHGVATLGSPLPVRMPSGPLLARHLWNSTLKRAMNLQMAGATIARASGRSSAPSAAVKASRLNSAESGDSSSSVSSTEAFKRCAETTKQLEADKLMSDKPSMQTCFAQLHSLSFKKMT